MLTFAVSFADMWFDNIKAAKSLQVLQIRWCGCYNNHNDSSFYWNNSHFPHTKKFHLSPETTVLLLRMFIAEMGNMLYMSNFVCSCQ